MFSKGEIVCLKTELLETIINEWWVEYNYASRSDSNCVFLRFGEIINGYFKETEHHFKYNPTKDVWSLTIKSEDNE